MSKLWERSRKGHHASYSAIHERMYPELQRYLSQMTKDSNLINDLLQDLFIKMWIKRNEIGSIANVRAYYFKACRLSFINHYRRQKRYQSIMDNYCFEELDHCIEDQISKLEEDKTFKNRLAAAMNKLPTRQRELFRLRYLDSLDYNEIVVMTGIKQQSAINLVYKAVQTLRKEFREIKPELLSTMPLYPRYINLIAS